jgi:transposase-like protein
VLTGHLVEMINSFDLRFPDDEACWQYLEATLWPNGPVCPKCDSVGDAAPWKPRPHRWQCRYCGAQFHVAQETALKGAHLPLRSWFEAIYLLETTPNISSVALGRALGIGQKTAWSVSRRIRDRMMTADRGLLRGIVAAVEELGSKPRKRRQNSANHHSAPRYRREV